jgi:putative transposase
MASRRIFDAEHHAQFVTFSCFRRRRLLDHPRMRDDFLATTAEKLRDYHGICSGFVVMPNHVHAIVWFGTVGSLSPFMKSWKQTTSIRLKRVLRGVAPHYAEKIALTDPFWQPKYYPFNLFTAGKAMEKLDYMHTNPIRAALVAAWNPYQMSTGSARVQRLHAVMPSVNRRTVLVSVLVELRFVGPDRRQGRFLSRVCLGDVGVVAGECLQQFNPHDRHRRILATLVNQAYRLPVAFLDSLALLSGDLSSLHVANSIM